MAKSDKMSKFISNIEPLDCFIVERFLEINGLKWKDEVALFARMVVKRSIWDSFRSGGGPIGFEEIDEHFMGYLDELIKRGEADPEVVRRYKNLSFIERHKYQLKAVTRTMLNEIIEGIESGRLGKKNGNGGGGEAPPEQA
jgi:hypothetical protein